MGVAGGCRLSDLANLTIDDIEDHGTKLVVHISDSKTSHRTFVVAGAEGHTFCPLTVYRKFISVRPRYARTRRLFLSYKNGKCTINVVGKNALAKIPSHVARYLELPDPERYTGYSFRQSLLRNSKKLVSFASFNFC